jgi:hypothetical protein
MFSAWVLVCVFNFSFLMRDMETPLQSAIVRIFWCECQRHHPTDQVAVGSEFLFCEVIRSEVNCGVGCRRFSVYINFYF